MILYGHIDSDAEFSQLWSLSALSVGPKALRLYSVNRGWLVGFLTRALPYCLVLHYLSER